ncbi:helix-turn-helix transcriptional regulator [Bradyrhizobium tropiciagri]|uniref:ArsR/SmtB family transcription factor n=1 Tax=Bradyrhizobium tropiciagri TaxID=312253 RepID=UPI001BA621F3|nr:metalloregulator ArsR/SmtB family transcription factor [Bradyrhizobium tropiciagri]MBR0893883.1 helix-turn-helix transcriptional regulator [Bradyrhizobium tropiciagri]
MPPDPLSSTFAALADPTRRAILARLALGETSVMELAKPFDMSLPAISKHLKVLEHAGLISRGREAQWRPCRIAPASFQQVDGWLGNFRRFWDESFNRLDGLLEEMKAEEAAEAPPRTTRKVNNRKVRVTKEKQRGRTRG